MTLTILLQQAEACRPKEAPTLIEKWVWNEGVRTYLTAFLPLENFVLTEEIIKEIHRLFYQSKCEKYSDCSERAESAECSECSERSACDACSKYVEAAGTYREESEELQRYIGHYLGQLEISKHLYHPIEFAVIAHKRFIDVSPFSRGNEEIAWFLLNLWLVRAGYMGICPAEMDRTAYEEALAEARNPQCPDPETLVLFITKMVLKAQGWEEE